jgi:general secretion pathway protein H
MRHSSSAHSHGFTLMELMVVMIILSITMGLVIPRIGAGWRNIEDRDFLQEFVTTLKRARLIAMNSGGIVAFRIRGTERLYDLQLPPTKPIPANVDIYADNLPTDPETQDHMILFYPDGSLVGNDVEIVFDHQRSFLISIHPLFGSVHWSRAEPR